MDLHEEMSHIDSFERDIQTGYLNDTVFRKILDKLELHPTFEMHDRILWTQNRGGEHVVCVPSAMSNEMTL